jgi:hypothetical protein
LARRRCQSVSTVGVQLLLKCAIGQCPRRTGGPPLN